MLRLLVLSDIHLLSMATELDSDSKMRKAFIKDVEDYKKTHGTINHILVSGDIASKGMANEYNAAYDFFKDVCEVVGCPVEEVYVVPGNHDKNFYAQNAELRHLIHAGLSNESLDSNKLFNNVLNNDFSNMRILYQPFKDYNDFAFKIDKAEPLMSKCLDEKNDSYNEKSDKAYKKDKLATIGNYQIWLYAMNTALIADWDDLNDFGNGHKLFLPQLGYNADTENEGCVNIVMMHHPTSNLISGEDIEIALDDNFQIQIFGHLHRPASDNNKCIHIHSGALQPPLDKNDKSNCYFSVYNIIELDIVEGKPKDKLIVDLLVQRYNQKSKEFEKVEEESHRFCLSLKKHRNRWKDESVKDNLPDGVTIKKIRFDFLQQPNPMGVIEHFSSYDNNISFPENCINFLKYMEDNNRLSELWNYLNKK